jgi:hypothetical protein
LQEVATEGSEYRIIPLSLMWQGNDPGALETSRAGAKQEEKVGLVLGEVFA